MQLSQIDASLLIPLHVLIQEQSVSRAAKRLGLSPSATSHTLSRLREALGDPLLVRSGRKLVLTPRAEELRAVVQRTVEGLEQVFLARQEFTPETLRRTFRVATTDHLEFVLLKPLSRALAEEAPEVSVQAVPLVGAELADALRRGEVDLAFGPVAAESADVRQQTILDDQFVVLLREGHPALSQKLTLRRFAALQHIMVSPTGDRQSVVDNALAAQGLERRVVLMLSSFFPAPFTVAESDYAVLISQRFVESMLPTLALRMVRPPMSLPQLQVAQMWHRSQHSDPAHVWFRDLLARVAGDLPPLLQPES